MNIYKIRNLFLVFVGIVLLIVKKHYYGPYFVFVHSYLGNISACFATYFILTFSSDHWKNNKLVTALIALILAESFEIFDGFGILQNTLDYYDLIFNFFGVSFALLIDLSFVKSISKSDDSLK